MLFSLKKETGHERPKDKKQKWKKQKQMKRYYAPPVPHRHPDMNQPAATYAIPPIIHNNNIMDTEFLVHYQYTILLN